MENAYWGIEQHMHKSLDLLSGGSNVNRYNNWCSLADKYPEGMRDCEIIVKNICHASVLRGHDYKYKNQLGTSKCVICVMTMK